MVLTFAACGDQGDEKASKDDSSKSKKKKDDDDDEKKDGDGNAVEKAAGDLEVKFEDVKGMVKKGKPISAKQYEKLVLAHANCKVTDQGIDSKCEAVKIMRESMNRSQLAKGALGGNSKLGQRLINHEHPAVRIKAAGMMGSLFGTADKSQDMIVEALRKEKHPAVMKAMIRTIRNDGARNPKVGKLLLELADHDNPMIQKEAVYGLSSSWNAELEGGPEKLIDLMKEDEDAEVRQAACKYAGKLGDAKLFPVYKELLSKRDDGKLWADCFQGLVEMWGAYPLYGTSSEDAYKLTIELLNSTPRTDEIPPWQGMSDFGYLRGETNKKLVEWKEKATWYDEAELRKALSAVIADGDANWMARTGAAKAIAKIGASKADLEKLRKGYGDDSKGNDKHVAKALDELIAKAE